MEWALKATISPLRVGTHVKLRGYQCGIEFWPLDPWLKIFRTRYGGIEHDTVLGPLFVYCRRISDIQRINDLG